MADKRVIRTDKAAGPMGGAPYSQAIVTGELVFVAGQLGLEPDGSGFAGESIEAQTEQIMRSLGAILEAAGSGLEKLVKTSVFLTDLADFQAMNAVYAQHVGSAPPARSTFQVAALPAGALVEIEAVAHL